MCENRSLSLLSPPHPVHHTSHLSIFCFGGETRRARAPRMACAVPQPPEYETRNMFWTTGRQLPRIPPLIPPHVGGRSLRRVFLVGLHTRRKTNDTQNTESCSIFGQPFHILSQIFSRFPLAKATHDLLFFPSPPLRFHAPQRACSFSKDATCASSTAQSQYFIKRRLKIKYSRETHTKEEAEQHGVEKPGRPKRGFLAHERVGRGGLCGRKMPRNDIIDVARSPCSRSKL